ncbi:cyclophilin-like fold protein [Emticicia agri]|uniref:Cyclophilin-like domain-containing protein n=1 Tax=Emticicia agri TaxID=2492393 RepID=A0A4Q5LV79_9BACT|nr:cyclophilin-like fold protein [Emticicia agri]RYU93631.1 hypothetical protein EWM59_21095 [Emticicia agri]
MNHHTQQVKVKSGEQIWVLNLNDCPASRGLMAFLPLSLRLTDLFGVQKYARLPEALTESGICMQKAEIGQVAYWAPGPGIVIFYRQYQLMPDSGFYLLGKIDSGANMLNIGQHNELRMEIS